MSTSLLRYADAQQLALSLREGVRVHTKDRKWRLKQYQLCFKASHAIAWAMEKDMSETVAVQRLNELISYGFLCHVVDPNTTIRVGEARTLYYRMIDDLIDDDIDANDLAKDQLKEGLSFGNSTRTVGGTNTIALQLRLDGVNHVLQETVTELHTAQGKMEMLQQEVLSLVSNQFSMLVIIALIYAFVLFVSVVHQLVPDISFFWWWVCFSVFQVAILIASTLCGMRCLAIVDSSNLIAPLDSIETETLATVDDLDESKLLTEKSLLLQTEKSFVRRRSITSILSKSMSSLIGRKSMKRLSSVNGQSIVYSREAYSLPNVEEWPHRPLLVCLNTPACPNHKVPTFGLGSCPIGVPFKFESDLFVGQCLIRLKGANSDNQEGDAEYFTGRKRIFQSVIQGQFKEKVKSVFDLDSLIISQGFISNSLFENPNTKQDQPLFALRMRLKDDSLTMTDWLPREGPWEPLETDA